ncbi:type VI secretion system baseplate subunit TssF [Terriglobus saanensis]|uniref:Type VI secretion protein, VC_A0110 family n=1 Tax=Terriglobus saanensis (strain ATCC BAA-1853 / DSM 23119 / SP1PR4) TaxID=401053 RepID=E8UX31_TERSS|nr:type VI secretion system baseplate subunit TssF [Terriglobus saanensis]ADV81918.1 type VI secretion protein, VC_A0110 family [Terriglobus saanensis SP1PR4]
MAKPLLEYYERELAYLRQMGAEFGERYPAIAGRLLLESDRCGDPHVERMLEAFSFLAARIHVRLDDDLPELTEGMLDIIYPHYLRPIPAMSIAQFTFDREASSLGAAVVVPAQSELITRRTMGGEPCRFQTSYPVDLWPIEIKECVWRRPEQIKSPARVPDAVGVLRVLLRASEGASLKQLKLERLNFYLGGEKSLMLSLYELLCRNLLQVVVRDPQSSETRKILLHRRCVQPMGFDEDESILPYTQRSFHGYRLLQEYFSFSEKFLFFSVNGLAEAMLLAESGELEVLFYFSQFDQPERAQALEMGVGVGSMKLGCTPIVNLFRQTAEPILVSNAKHAYRVNPSSRHHRMTEIFSIDEVKATNPSRRSSTTLRPLFEHRFHRSSEEEHIFWRSSRKQAEFDQRRPSEVFLTIVDRNSVMMQPNAEILNVHCTCTNHDYPSSLSFGDPGGDFDLQGGGGVGPIQMLHRPTATSSPPAVAGQVWSLISQLSLNHLSLSEGGLQALKEILRLHNFTESPHLDRQIDGIRSFKSARHIALMQSEHGSVAARGTRIELELDEEEFVGGGAYLFSAVLNRFFGLYVSMNSFSQLSVRSTQRKEGIEEWLPRAGSQVVM